MSRRYLRSCPTIAGPYGNDLKNDTLRQERRARCKYLPTAVIRAMHSLARKYPHAQGLEECASSAARGLLVNPRSGPATRPAAWASADLSYPSFSFAQRASSAWPAGFRACRNSRRRPGLSRKPKGSVPAEEIVRACQAIWCRHANGMAGSMAPSPARWGSSTQFDRPLAIRRTSNPQDLQQETTSGLTFLSNQLALQCQSAGHRRRLGVNGWGR